MVRTEGYFTSTFAMVEGVKQPSKTDRLATRMRRYASAEQLILMRNLGYGGAAACLVILVQLAQVGTGEIPLKVTVVATSVSLPLWLMLGATYELYIFLGKKATLICAPNSPPTSSGSLRWQQVSHLSSQSGGSSGTSCLTPSGCLPQLASCVSSLPRYSTPFSHAGGSVRKGRARPSLKTTSSPPARAGQQQHWTPYA